MTDTHIEEIAEAEPDLAEYVRSSLSIEHRDLFQEIVEKRPESAKYPSLSEALSSRGIENPTAELADETVDGSLMPTIGSRVLDAEKTLGRHERSALKKYAASDVTPLHKLADTIDREQRAAAEADAVTDGGQ